MYALHAILAATTSTTTKGSSKSSGSTYTLIFIVVAFAAVYFLFLRPRQQRMRQQQTTAKQLSIGDQVVSAGGIYGRVVAMDNDVAEVEVAPGVVMTFLRRAINARPDATPVSSAEPIDEEWQRDREREASADDDDLPGDPSDQHP
jgi:preprotein translocase subunit YajC